MDEPVPLGPSARRATRNWSPKKAGSAGESSIHQVAVKIGYSQSVRECSPAAVGTLADSQGCESGSRSGPIRPDRQVLILDKMLPPPVVPEDFHMRLIWIHQRRAHPYRLLALTDSNPFRTLSHEGTDVPRAISIHPHRPNFSNGWSLGFAKGAVAILCSK